jgi:hypothetical protein
MRKSVRALLAFVALRWPREGTVRRAQSVGGAPVITVQPQSQSVASGESASFNVQAEGAAPLRYQWRLNGTNLPNATNPTFAVSNARLFNGGAYTAVVSNSLRRDEHGCVLTVDPDLVFRIITLETNGAITVDHNNLTGDDRGGIAVSANNIFYTGDGVMLRRASIQSRCDSPWTGWSAARAWVAVMTRSRQTCGRKPCIPWATRQT